MRDSHKTPITVVQSSFNKDSRNTNMYSNIQIYRAFLVYLVRSVLFFSKLLRSTAIDIKVSVVPTVNVGYK